MANIFFSSDNHYNHSNFLTFLRNDGVTKIRPEFADVDEMNEVMIERHNSVVGLYDKWYCMGDLFIGKGRVSREKFHEIMPRLNGKKRLILGNHDDLKMAEYSQHFEKIMESRRMDAMLFTHRPAFLGSVESHVKASVHGHIHEQNINDPRYLNLSVEQINYTPISYEDIVKIYTERGINVL